MEVTNARLVGDTLATLTALQRQFRSWAVWRDGRGEWTATRAEDGRAGLLWVRASTAEQLVAKMREADGVSTATGSGPPCVLPTVRGLTGSPQRFG